MGIDNEEGVQELQNGDLRFGEAFHRRYGVRRSRIDAPDPSLTTDTGNSLQEVQKGAPICHLF